MHNIGQIPKNRNEMGHHKSLILTFFIILWGFAKFSIPISTRNEMALTFEFEEELPLQSHIGDVLNQLRKSYTNPNLNFKFQILQDSNHSSLFAIDNSKGVLRTVGRIDRETICPSFTDDTCTVNLKIIVSGSTNPFIVEVELVITDINDHTPTFNSNVMDISVFENAPLGSMFPIPIAIDHDSRQNSVRFYELLNASYVPFSLEQDEHKYTGRINSIQDSSLSLKLEQLLDRESVETIQLMITAVDGGMSPRTGTLIINVNVQDINDNKPIFERYQYNISLDEETSYRKPVLKVRATDGDAGVNGKVMYELSRPSQTLYSSLFKINAESGELTVKSKLDFESRPSYTIEVIARDGGVNQLTGITLIQVTVIDLNDNSPTISLTSIDGNQTNRIIVGENLEHPYTFAFISVKDLDVGLNGVCQCRLETFSETFNLAHLYETIYSLGTKTKLDRENVASYHVIVTCWDAGRPSQNSSLQILVEVSDENDNAPYFVKHSFQARVDENSKESTAITRISAYDLDVGANAETRYKIQNDTVSNLNYVKLDEVTGWLTAGARQFDHEDFKKFNFTVVAFNVQNPALYSLADVSIEIIDLNDQPPIFESDVIKYRILENQTVGISISTIETIDLDQDEKFQQSKYRLSCCDDYNDYESSCYFEKSIDKNTVLYSANILKEYFESNILSDLVTIDELTGELKSNAIFDRERDSTINFCIIATNLAHPYFSSTAQVTIEIDDVNDNPPIIVFPKFDYILEVSSWTEENEILMKIFAEDPDKNETNSLLSYHPIFSIEDKENRNVTIANHDVLNNNEDDELKPTNLNLNVNDLFAINRYTGEIRLTRFLRDTDFWNNCTFIFRFSVNDSGSPNQKTEGSFTIHIHSDEDFKLRDFRRQNHFSKFVNNYKNLFLLLVLCSSSFLLIVVLTITICYTKWRMRKSRRPLKESKIPPAVYLVNIAEKEIQEKHPVKKNSNHTGYRPHYRHQLQNSPSSDSGRGQSEVAADVIMMMADKNLVSKTHAQPLFQQTYEPKASNLLENGIFCKRGYEFLEAHHIALNNNSNNRSCISNSSRCFDDVNLTETFI
ncbi:hypothetical protein HELRODRAFT_178411 [Helobdella robusta]|uniref:Cadherin domain-containing protein n=1 Tax=Helobdella robusta TaxID=6412 RepID=T1FD49_HELRO|nr:hypothetical protein HELRODRAFT_178411 [Helobdella robusta]ESN97283.1 hypothetical protein HELRODRAFT_178411 [Helobdella robusta]